MNLLQRIARSPLIACLGVAVLFQPVGRSVAEDSKPPTKIDFEEFEVGSEPDLFVIEGTFIVRDDAGNKVLELQPQPLSESGVIFGKSLKGAASVTVDIKASKKRRSTPRFGVGLHGISGYRLRLVPATNVIELVKSEEAVKSAEFKGNSGEWLSLRLAIETGADGKWVISGWAWPKGSEAPKDPVITMQSEEKPGQGKASIWGTPYSGTPILYDNLVIQDAAKAAQPDGEEKE